MNSAIQIMVLVEGQTEKTFIKSLLSPYLADLTDQNIFLIPTLAGKQGGDVRFSRYQKDIGHHLKQRPDTYITLMVDFYGIRNDWPGFKEAKQQSMHSKKAAIMNQETEKRIQELFPEQNHRFIPYVSMHEIEALYFSDPASIANIMNINEKRIESILEDCDGPEAINDSPKTSPSKRLEELSPTFKKISTGIAIAEAVGIKRMREQCPLFNEWICKIECVGH
ncbi:MAG: DUF4276 family protein [Methanomicrobiales archaeon]|jgi:hypothetical protein|nr:DUF4276 family protein [Methanomicrobiales archaeon]